MSRRPKLSLPIAALVSVGLLAPAALDGARAAVPRSEVSAVARVASVPVADPERTSTTPTGWGWHPNASVATIKAFTKTGQRIVDLEVNKAAAKPTFAVSYVANSGDYQRGWWWYYGLSAEKVKAKLKAKKARLIDIEPYRVSGKTRYAVVMVKNKGIAKKTWKWFSKSKLSTIRAWAKQNRMRIVDSERFTVGGATRYSAVLIKNKRNDQAKWWHYYGLSATGVKAQLEAKKARLVNLERRSNGTFDVVMTRGGFAGSWWYATGRTSAQVTTLVDQVGGRIFMVDSRVVNGTRLFDVLVLDNTAAETRRIRNLVQGRMSGSWGFYAKSAGGPVVAALNASTVFEPASAIKVVHAVTALRDVQAGNRTLTSLVPWRQHPSFPARYSTDPGYSPSSGTRDKDVCAYNNSGAPNGVAVTDELGSILLDYSLGFSDNRTTDALIDLYGFAGVNQTIALAGMTKSRIVHRIGCGTTWDRSTDFHNRLTLVDAGKLYEEVANGGLLGPTGRSSLYGYLVGGIPDPTSDLAAMINSEAVAAGLSASDRREFLSRVRTHGKGGSYGLCAGGDDCLSTRQIRTSAGVLLLPHRFGEQITTRSFVYGHFFDTTVPCDFDDVDDDLCAEFEAAAAGTAVMAVEVLRQPVREALATW